MILTTLLLTSLLSAIEPNVERVTGQDGFTNPETKPTDAQTIHHFADTAFIYGMILGADLYTTELARNHNPLFAEQNKLLLTSSSAQAAKVMVMASVTYMDYKFYQRNKKGAIKLRRFVVLASSILIANNLYIAFGARRSNAMLQQEKP